MTPPGRVVPTPRLQGVTVGVLGAGVMAETHLAALARLGVPAAAYSPSGRGAALAAQFGARGYDDLPALISAVDVVDICSPTDTHLDLACAAFAAGKAVICEKPLARTRDDARALVDAARKAGAPLYVAHVVRYFAAYRAAREMIGRGDLGEVTELQLRRTGASPTSAWFHDASRSGGVLMDQLIHDFDFARWTLGGVIDVSASLRGEPAPADAPPITRAQVTLRHANGAMSHLVGGWLDQGATFTTELRAVGTAGTLQHSNLDGALTVQGAATGRTVPLPANDLPYDAQLAEFLGHLAGGPKPRIGVDDALAALDLTLAAIKSAHSGRPVRVS